MKPPTAADQFPEWPGAKFPKAAVPPSCLADVVAAHENEMKEILLDGMNRSRDLERVRCLAIVRTCYAVLDRASAIPTKAILDLICREIGE